MKYTITFTVLALCLTANSGFAKGKAKADTTAKRTVAEAMDCKYWIEEARNSGRIADADQATTVCQAGVEAICKAKNNGTGDGRYLRALCNAEASAAAFNKVSE